MPLPLLLALPLAFAGQEATSPVEPPRNARVARFAGWMPQPVTSFGACAAGGWLYVLGGYFGPTHAYDREHQSRLFLRLSLADLSSWEVLPLAERGLQGAVLAAHAGRIVRAGGMVAKNGSGAPQDLASVDEVTRFDPLTSTWEALPPLPQPRSSHAGAVADGKLVIVGGWQLGGELEGASRFLADAAVLDLEHPELGWRAVPAPFRRRGLAAASLRGAIVVLGGMDEHGERSRRVDVLDTATLAWSRGPDLPETGFGAAAASSDGCLYASGANGVLLRWAPGDASWQACGSLGIPRIFHQLVATPSGDLIALGGVAGRTHVRALELLQPVQGERVVISRLRIPAPGLALNRQAAAVQGDQLLLFGGNRSPGQHDFEPENFLSEGWSLDLRSLEWRQRPELPVHRQSLQVAFDGANLWALGGFGHDGERLRSFGEGFVLAGEAAAWERGAPLPEPLTQFGLVAEAGALWVLGGLEYVKGRPGGGGDFRFPQTVWRKDLAGGREAAFEAVETRLPRQRRAFGCAVLDGRAYLIGGLADGFERVEACDVLDLAAGSWSTIAAPRRTRISPELVSLGGRLFLAGGSSQADDGASRADSSIEAFDPRTGAWSLLADELPLDPTHMRLFVHRQRLLAISTQTAGVLELVWIEPR